MIRIEPTKKGRVLLNANHQHLTPSGVLRLIERLRTAMEKSTNRNVPPVVSLTTHEIFMNEAFYDNGDVPSVWQVVGGGTCDGEYEEVAQQIVANFRGLA